MSVIKHIFKFDTCKNIKPSQIECNGIVFRIFHYQEDPPSVYRFIIETNKIRAVIAPTKGLALHEAWIDNQPIFWDPPRTSLPAPEGFTPENALLINGKRQWGTEWVKWFCSGTELLGPDNWGMAQAEEHKTLHGRGSNTPAENITIGISGRKAVVEGSFSIHDEPAHYKLIRRVIIDPGDSSILMYDNIKNISQNPLSVDWGYHIQMRPSNGCRYYIPSEEISSRKNEYYGPGFNTWKEASVPDKREEYGYLHSKINHIETLYGIPIIGTLLYYPDRKSIRCDIPPAPFISTWISAGGAYGKEFISNDINSAPILSKNWDGIGPEIGASALDHDGKINYQFQEKPLPPGESKQIYIRFKLLKENETCNMLKQMPLNVAYFS